MSEASESDRPPTEADITGLRRMLRWGLLSLLVAGIVFAASAWHRARTLEQTRLRALSALAAQSVDLYLGQFRHVLPLFPIATPLSRAAIASADRYLTANPDLAGVAHVDPADTQVLLRGDGRVISLTRAARATLQSHLEPCVRHERGCLGSPWTPAGTTRPLLPLAFPGPTPGTWSVFLLPVRGIHRLWRGHTGVAPVTIGLMTDRGQLLDRWPTNAAPVPLHPGGILARSLARRQGARSGTYQGRVTVDHSLRIGAYHQLTSYPLVVFVSLPMTYLVHQWGLSVIYPTLLIAILMAFAYGIFRWISFREGRATLERQSVERHLSETRERALITLQSIADAVITTDINGIIEYLNPAAQRLTGVAAEEAMGRPLGTIYAPFDESGHRLPSPIELCRSGSRAGGLAQPAVLIGNDGRQFSIEYTAAPIRNPSAHIRGVVVTFHDITEKRLLNERVAYQATHDMLTDLPNRTLFHDQLTRLTAQHGEAFSLIFIDLDGFKAINDGFGHYVGDRAIVAVSQRIRANLSEGDLLARYGGDEFAVIARCAPTTIAAMELASRIIDGLKSPILSLPEEVVVGASLGIAFYPQDADDPDLLCRAADAAMYEAKAKGKSGFQLFEAQQQGGISRFASLESALRRALDRNELSLLYQPEVDLRTRTLVGAEVLLRWQNSDLGTVPPAQFIHLAEQNGLILPIGEWVLVTACRQNQKWRRQQLPAIRVGVNVSGRQCRDDSSARLVDRALSESGLAQDGLQIELTESLLMRGDRQVLHTLETWKERGVSLAIDDFGTGYSSLSYLKHLPVDTLKIDRSFMPSPLDNGSDSAIVRAIVTVGHSLNLKIVAEGVESDAQADFLQTLDCDIGQGHHFGRPMSAADFEHLLRASHAPLSPFSPQRMRP